jgi:hypothetical protein
MHAFNSDVWASPIIPLLEGPNARVKPMTIQRILKIASPEKGWIRTEIEFLLRMRPASKKPKAGVIIITRPVAINIHPCCITCINIQRRFVLEQLV